MMRSLLSALATLLLAAPLVGQDYHFTREMASGSRLSVDNINGDITVTQATGRIAEITVTKTVKRGDGSLVKSIIENDPDGGINVCTIYLNQNPERNSCHGKNGENHSGHTDHLEVTMHYVVRLPRGVRLAADNVIGNIDARGLDTEAKLETVNGSIDYEGATASNLTTVNGHINATMSRGSWDGELHAETVNGSITLGFPSDLSATISGETVNGGITSDDAFPITIEGKWGPKEFHGKIGSGSSKLTVETVNGSISIRRSGRGS